MMVVYQNIKCMKCGHVWLGLPSDKCPLADCIRNRGGIWG